MGVDYFVVAESEHELQNPTSEDKILLLGHRLGLGAESRVLDIASGRGGPAVLLAAEFGCTVEGIEIRTEFHAVARERAERAGMSDRVRFELGDAASASVPREGYDVAMCLGASFVWRDLAGTLDALVPVVRPGGHVVVGEPYWRRLLLPEGYRERNEPFTTLADTLLLFELAGLVVVYLRYRRDYLGWAIFAGWKRPWWSRPKRRLALRLRDRDDRPMERPFDDRDVNSLMSGVFDIRATLEEIETSCA